MAKGEYVIFPDSDDWLADDYVSTIMKAIEDYDSPDFLFFDHYEGSDKKGFKRHIGPKFSEGIIAKELFIRENIKNTTIRGYMHCKAIKKVLFNGLLFNTNTRVAEDYELLTDLVLKIDKIVYVPKSLYYYVKREGSLTHTSNFEDVLKFYDLALDRFTKHSSLYEGLSNNDLVKAAALVLIRAYAEKRDEEKQFTRYKMVIYENIKRIILSSDFNLNDKKQCLLIYLGLGKFYYSIKYGH